ncbi:MAG: hypothetical protein WBE18_01625 [Gammaproteobacteria bacterium]
MNASNQVTNKGCGLFYIKLGCLLFWTVWFSVAFTTNFFDFLSVVGWLSKGWHFLSGNYHALVNVLHVYNTPPSLLNILFALDISTQGISAILFFTAFICFWRNVYVWQIISLAFGVSMALWAAFLVMEEVFIAYPFEATHIRLLIFEMICLLMFYLLPHQIPHRRQKNKVQMIF